MFIYLKPFNSAFLFIELWFIDQILKPLHIEDKINITLMLN